MCTAVVGGSIHRAATRISTASDQRSATPMRNHRTKDRRELLRGGVGGVGGGVARFSVTLQNNRLGWIAIARKALTRTSHRTTTLHHPGARLPRRPFRGCAIRGFCAWRFWFFLDLLGAWNTNP